MISILAWACGGKPLFGAIDAFLDGCGLQRPTSALMVRHLPFELGSVGGSMFLSKVFAMLRKSVLRVGTICKKLRSHA